MALKIPFAKVDCSGNEIAYIKEVLAGGWLTTAAKTMEFEKRFATAVGAQFCCAVNSCTAALHLAVEGLGLGPGDKALAPTMSFTATAEVLRYVGADPVFTDVAYGTNLITPEILEQAMRKHPQIKAVIVVHYGGQAADMDALLELCRPAGIKIIEDAAHAFPCRYRGRPIGSFGDVACFSFYANKTITTGEGGMLATNNEALFKRAKIMRLHGINRDVWDRFTSDKPSWEYDVVAPGFKYNMPDINAAIGLAQLERAEMLRRERQRCALFYNRHLANIPCLDLPKSECAPEDHAWHLYPIVLLPESGISRNDFIVAMSEYGIGASVHYKPLHRMRYYRERYGLQDKDFPNAERIWKGNVSLPIYPTLSDDELEYVCKTIRGILRASKQT